MGSSVCPARTYTHWMSSWKQESHEDRLLTARVHSLQWKRSSLKHPSLLTLILLCLSSWPGTPLLVVLVLCSPICSPICSPERPIYLSIMNCSIHDVTPGVPRKACRSEFSIVIYGNIAYVKMAVTLFAGEIPSCLDSSVSLNSMWLSWTQSKQSATTRYVLLTSHYLA